MMIQTRAAARVPQHNKLIVPSLFLGCIPILIIPYTILFPDRQYYLVYFLPVGFLAALLARIALNQMKDKPCARLDRSLAVLSYFLGLSPALYACGQLTYWVMFQQ